MSVDTFKAAKTRIEELEALLAAKNSSGASITCRVGPSGGLSLYGMGKFPVTLHGNQWRRLADYLSGTDDNAKTFWSMVHDSQEGETLGNGRPAGNGAHQQRVRDAEVRAASLTAKREAKA
jgi:hypothetical protein